MRAENVLREARDRIHNAASVQALEDKRLPKSF